MSKILSDYIHLTPVEFFIRYWIGCSAIVVVFIALLIFIFIFSNKIYKTNS
jgi:hypothetical protein